MLESRRHFPTVIPSPQPSPKGRGGKTSTAQQRFSNYPAIPPPVRVPLQVSPPHECPYLTGRMATARWFVADRVAGNVYHQFMNAGFRRSGRLFYQPVCGGCRACVPIRVPVDSFWPSKSQRRTLRRNADVIVSVNPRPVVSDEKFALYTRYTRDWHGKDDGDDFAGFESFLYASPVDTIEFEYRDATGRLLAVGICDGCADSLSSVYFYFDPAESKRGLGTFGALREIEYARERGMPFYYLGYWISGCGAMEYKSSFRPNQLLGTDGVWRDNLDEVPASVAVTRPPRAASCADTRNPD
jgi:arginyl-tRNA--protein-N-Asp/Glu arginylyltransferase